MAEKMTYLPLSSGRDHDIYGLCEDMVHHVYHLDPPYSTFHPVNMPL